jgi:tetratricopeptide (TPR) repeat protein
MHDIHITRDLLAAVAAGTLPAERLLAEALHHLESRCETCREEISAALEASTARPATAGELAMALGALTARLGQEAPAALAHEATVAAWVRELQAVPAAERVPRVARARRRFRGRAFAEAALAECRRALPARPAESHAWAAVAARALPLGGLTPETLPVFARALAWTANGHRALGDLRTADGGFRGLRRLLAEGGVTDSLALAEADTLEGSLRKDQRRFDEANALLARAIEFYQLLGESVEAELTRLKQASAANLAGQPVQAVHLAWQTLRVLSPDDHPRLHLMARFNLAWYLNDAGKPLDALKILVYDEDVYDDHANDHLLLHRRWLEGKIAFAMADPELAEPLLRDVRRELLKSKNGFDVALISIDLALLLLSTSRHREVQQLASEAVALFEAQGVHREARAALVLFAEAARDESLTREFLTRLAEYLPRVAADRELGFGGG